MDLTPTPFCYNCLKEFTFDQLNEYNHSLSGVEFIYETWDNTDLCLECDKKIKPIIWDDIPSDTKCLCCNKPGDYIAPSGRICRNCKESRYRYGECAFCYYHKFRINYVRIVKGDNLRRKFTLEEKERFNRLLLSIADCPVGIRFDITPFEKELQALS